MSTVNIVVAWNGLPAYGARLLQEARDHIGVQFPVLGTKPDVPIQGMEQILGGGLVWLKAGNKYSWAELGLSVPDLFVHTGWKYPHFISLANEVRRAGGKVVGMFDNCWKPTLRQRLGAFYFRLFLRKKYAAAWVPGASGRKLALELGFSTSDIMVGMYGASSEIFSNEIPMASRPKRIIYVGRLNQRKGVLELVEAFRRVYFDFTEWRLLIVGAGELEAQIKGIPSVEHIPFQQPQEIAKLMNKSRVFALASREEHWGLVVHEAALCGCALLLQKYIGAASDLGLHGNSILFSETNAEEIERSLRCMLTWSDDMFERASSASVEHSSKFGPHVWAHNLKAMVDQINEK